MTTTYENSEPLVRKSEGKHGCYRAKDRILSLSDALADVAKLIEPLDRDSCLLLLGSLNWHCMWVELTHEDRWRGATSELDALIVLESSSGATEPGRRSQSNHAHPLHVRETAESVPRSSA